MKYLIIILLLSSCFLGWMLSKQKDTIKSKDKIISEQNDHIQKVTTKYNTTVFKKNRVEADLKSIQSGYPFLKDSLKQMGLKVKDLESALFLAQETTGSGTGRIDTVTIVKHDTTYLTDHIKIRERFLEFDAWIYPNRDYSYEYTAFDSLMMVNTTSRKNIFSKWEYTTNVLNANRNTVVKGVTSLTVKEKGYTWVIGPAGGYGMTQHGLTPFIGLVVVKPIIKL